MFEGWGEGGSAASRDMLPDGLGEASSWNQRPKREPASASACSCRRPARAPSAESANRLSTLKGSLPGGLASFSAWPNSSACGSQILCRMAVLITKPLWL